MNKAERITCAGCSILIVLHLVASYFPHQRLWGLNLLHYVPAVFRWIAVAAAFVVLIPAVNRKLARGLAWVFHRVNHFLKPLGKDGKHLGLSLLSLPLFWLFKEKMYLLGDGNLRASEIVAGRTLSLTEPLDFLLHALVFKLTGWSVFTVYALLSCLAGVAFVYLLLTLSDRMGESGEERVLIFTVLITMGANQLFFGYVESYGLMYASMVAYLFFSWLHVERSIGLHLPILFFLLTAGFHLAGLVLLPSLLYLMLSRSNGKSTKDRVSTCSGKSLWIALLLLLVGGGLWALWRQFARSGGLDSLLLFPLGSLKASLYPIWSASHLLDLLNHQILVSPVGVMVWLVLAFSTKREAHARSRETILFLLVIIPQLLFAVLFNPQLGYSRDWDLFAFTATGYTIVGVCLLAKRLGESKPEVVRYVTLTLVLTAALSTAPWIYVNATQEKAISRFNDVLNFDPQRAALGHECLAYNYRRLGDKGKEAEEWGSAIALFPKPRYVKNLGVVYVEMGEYRKAAEQLEEVIRLDPEDDVTYDDLGKLYVLLNEKENAQDCFEKAIDLRPDNPDYYENLGLLLLNWGKNREAIPVLTRALQLGPDRVAVYRYLGIACVNSGDYAFALKQLRLYLDYAPQAQDRIQVEAMIEELEKKVERR